MSLRILRSNGADEETTAEGADGTSECPGVSTHERGDAGASSHPRDIQQADKSIRVRNAGERLLPRPRFSLSDPRSQKLSLARVPLTFERQRAARLASGRVAEAALLPTRSARSFGRQGTGMKRQVLRRNESGAMTRVCVGLFDN